MSSSITTRSDASAVELDIFLSTNEHSNTVCNFKIVPSLSKSSPRNGWPLEIKPSTNFVNATSPLSRIPVRNLRLRSDAVVRIYIEWETISSRYVVGIDRHTLISSKMKLGRIRFSSNHRRNSSVRIKLFSKKCRYRSKISRFFGLTISINSPSMTLGESAFLYFSHSFFLFEKKTSIFLFF